MKALSVVFVCACAGSGAHVPPDAPLDVRENDAAVDAAVDGDPGCGADSECASGACDETTGVCIDEARVLFVATTGADAATCTRTAPCATIGRATELLGTGRDTIAVAAGSYAGTFTITKPAMVSGPSRDPRDVELSSTDHKAIIAVLDGAAITLEGLSIGGNTDMMAAQAVTIGQMADVTLDRVVVHDNHATGVFVDASKLTVRRYEAFASSYGVLAGYTTTLDVDRAYVHDCSSAGLAAAADYRVANTVLAHNAIGFIPFNENTGVLEFVTFAGQTSTVISSTHAITVADSIFSQNATPPSAPVAISYSLFTGAAPPGIGNFAGDPAFVDAGHGDYHIGSTSPAIDRADPTAVLATDFDGAKRPTGMARDIGADERP